VTDPAPSLRPVGTYLATLASLGLGLVAAVMMVAGHPPWEGSTVVSLTATHGLHRGDVVALVPVAAGLGLAAWCWRHGR
jgi:hypothetical protein